MLRTLDSYGDTYFSTLAAAYAENRAWQQARDWSIKALDHTRSDRSKKIITDRMRVYEQQQPYRDDGKVLMIERPPLRRQ